MRKVKIAKRAVAVAALALGCGLLPPEEEQGAPAAEAEQTDLPPPGYVLVWADEFSGSALDTTRWEAVTGTRRDALMVRDAARVRDGLLTLTTSTQAGLHRTAFLTTEGLFEATFGYFEARIRFRGAPGHWCAFWLNSPTNGDPIGDPATAGVEIDVVEHRVTDQGGWTALADMVALNLNWDGYGPERQNAQRVLAPPQGGAVQGAWRVYGVLWTEEGYTFYVDGVPLWTINEGVSQRPEYIHLTCEVEDGSWAGFVPSAGYGSPGASTTGMQVDWVRVWQPE